MFCETLVVSKTNLNLNLRPLNVPLAKLLNEPKLPDPDCDVATCIWQFASSAAAPSKLPSIA